jgi:hypothetical protein
MRRIDGTSSSKHGRTTASPPAYTEEDPLKVAGESLGLRARAGFLLTTTCKAAAVPSIVRLIVDAPSGCEISTVSAELLTMLLLLVSVTSIRSKAPLTVPPAVMTWRADKHGI